MITIRTSHIFRKLIMKNKTKCWTHSAAVPLCVEEQGCVLEPEPVSCPPQLLPKDDANTFKSVHANKKRQNKVEYSETHHGVFPLLQVALQQQHRAVRRHVAPLTHQRQVIIVLLLLLLLPLHKEARVTPPELLSYFSVSTGFAYVPVILINRSPESLRRPLPPHLHHQQQHHRMSRGSQ